MSWISLKTSGTLHLVVAYYTCPEHHTTVREAIFHIVSDDNTHDGHAVAAFVDKVTEHLRVKRGLTLERDIQFTDGAASQYKSKLLFADLSFGVEHNGKSRLLKDISLVHVMERGHQMGKTESLSRGLVE